MNNQQESKISEQFVTHSTGNPGRPFSIAYFELNVVKNTSALGSRRVNKPLAYPYRIEMLMKDLAFHDCW